MDAKDLIYIARSMYGAALGLVFTSLIPYLRSQVGLEAPLLGKILLALAVLYLPTIPLAWILARVRSEDVPPTLLVFKGAAGYLAAWFIALMFVYNI